MSDWREDVIRHKYDPLPEEARHHKRAKRSHVRSDHKHQYEEIMIDTFTIFRDSKGRPLRYEPAKRCRICGRLKDWKTRMVEEPPDGVHVYLTRDWYGLRKTMVLPDSARVSR